MQPILTAQQLYFAYQDQPPVVNNWSCELTPGLTWLVGGDGSGKTTVLKLLAGELAASSGNIHLLGHTPVQAQYAAQVFFNNPRSTQWDQYTLEDYFASQAKQYQLWNPGVQHAIAQALGLDAHRNKHLYMLSAGSKRKVWLTAACASGAALTLIDEPFAALDTQSMRVVHEILQDVIDSEHRAWLLADYERPAEFDSDEVGLIGL